MSLIASENITFEEAIAFTEEFIEKIPNMSEQEKELALKSLVKTNTGARGFFVTYLTNENPRVDEFTTGIVQGLASFPEIVGELLVKNMAMSTAMKVYHLRNNDLEMAESSNRVTQRSKKLIEVLNLEIIKTKINQLKNTLETNEGEYQSFIKRFGYDEEQKQAILGTI